jgi:hypothetical protein
MGFPVAQPRWTCCSHQGRPLGLATLPMFGPTRSMNHHEPNFHGHLEISMARGRSNEKKYHLINWKVVKNPKYRGGLRIIDPTMMNVAMGEFFLWRMIIGKLAWWKKVLWRKYFRGTRQRCIKLPLEELKGSPILKLIKSCHPSYSSEAHLDPWEWEKYVKIWEDNIYGREKLST